MPFSVVNKRNARIFDPVNRAVQFVGFEGLRPLFSAGQPGHWPDSYDPALGRLFQDAVGITPVTAPGQPVGLVKRAGGSVDASQGTALSRPTLGRWPRGGRRNLLTWTEDLSNADWTKSGTLVVGQKTNLNTGAGMTRIAQSVTAGQQHSIHRSTMGIPVVTGQNVTYTVDVEAAEFSNIILHVAGTSMGYPLVNASTGGVAGGAGQTSTQMIGSVCRITVQTTTTETSIYPAIWPNDTGTAAGDGTSGIWIGRTQLEIGTTATPYQRVTTQYDITEGQDLRNLLTWTEDFSNAVWVKDTDGTATAPVVTPNYGLAPDGSTSASRVVYARGSGGGNASRLHSPGVTMSVGQRTQWSVWVKNTNPGPGQTLRMSQSGAAAKVITVTNDWTRFVQEWPSTTAGFWRGRLDVESFITGESADVMIWGGQLEFGSVVTPYQRVTTGYEDFGGVPSVWHLYNDGGDSLPITLPAGTYGRARVNTDGQVTVDTVVDPTDALSGTRQVDVILRQGAFTPEEEAKIRAYWARYAA